MQSLEDARLAADGLKEGIQQILNLASAPQGVRERIVDFLNGVVYAIEGSVGESERACVRLRAASSDYRRADRDTALPNRRLTPGSFPTFGRSSPYLSMSRSEIAGAHQPYLDIGVERTQHRNLASLAPIDVRATRGQLPT